MLKNAGTRSNARFLCAAAIALSACSAPGTSHESVGNNHAADTAFPNDQSTYHYFRNKGFTNFQAAAIVGNLDQESGIDPNISQQNGGPGRGIAQWSAGGRWDSDANDNVVAYAAQQGKSPYALDLQLDFIMYELTTFPDYGLAQLKASTNVSDATTDFELGFEGCAIPAQCDADSRINYAKSVLAAYGNDPVDTDASAPGDDAGPTTPPGDDDAGPTTPGDDDDDDAGSAHPTEDAGKPSKPHDAGAGSAPPSGDAPTSTSSGCAIGVAHAAGDASHLAWIAALGLACGVRRRRAR